MSDVSVSDKSKSDAAPITDLLRAWGKGSSVEEEALFEEVYRELHRLAGVFMAGERHHHSLQPTALIHEAFLRLSRRRQTPWNDRRHFFATAAQVMRRVLVDHARSRNYKKRNGGISPISLDDAPPTVADPGGGDPQAMLDLDDALRDLESLDPFKARLVELRFFAGFSIAETARLLDCSMSTVQRQWRLAQGWLYQELKAEGGA